MTLMNVHLSTSAQRDHVCDVLVPRDEPKCTHDAATLPHWKPRQGSQWAIDAIINDVIYSLRVSEIWKFEIMHHKIFGEESPNPNP